MQGGDQAGVLRGLHRHGRALAEGAIEHDALVGRARELVQDAAGADILLQVAVGRVQRARDAAVLLRARSVSRKSMKATSGRPTSAMPAPASSAQPRRAISCCARPIFMLDGTATSIIFGFGRFRLAISVDIVVDRLDLQARIVALLLADGGHGVAFVVVRGKHHGLVGQPQQLAEQRFILRARVAVLEIGAAGAADQQRVAGEHAVAPSGSCRNRRCGRACRARPCSGLRW